MFSSGERLCRTADIVMTLRKGRRAQAAALSAYYLPRSGSGRRFTVIVDKKVSKKAVVRNLIKRRLRSLMRDRQWQGDLVVRAFPGAEKYSFQDMGVHLGRINAKVGVR